jgi:hypothetical protein
MTKSFFLSVSAALLLALAGCGSGGGGTFVDGAGEVFTNISNGIFLIPVIF